MPPRPTVEEDDPGSSSNSSNDEDIDENTTNSSDDEDTDENTTNSSDDEDIDEDIDLPLIDPHNFNRNVRGGRIPMRSALDMLSASMAGEFAANMAKRLKLFFRNIKELSNDFTRWREANPKLFWTMAICIPSVLGISTCTIVGTVAILGFTSGGIAAGSIAAIIQAGIGNVIAGSAFAIIQSLTATGMIWPAATGVSALGMGAAYGGKKLWDWMRGRGWF